MEKRLVIAFLLSFLVLVVWQKVFPPPEPDPATESQVLVNKEDVDRQARPVASFESPSLPPVAVETQTESLENGQLAVEFSNIGGAPHSVEVKSYAQHLPVTSLITLENQENQPFRLVQKTADSITYSSMVNGLEVTKTYRLPKDDFLIFATVTIKNTSLSAQTLIPTINTFVTEMSSLDINDLGRDRSLLEYAIFTPQETIREGNAFQFSPKKEKTGHSTVDMVSFRSRYFATIVKPLVEVSRYDVAVLSEKKMAVTVTPEVQQVQPGGQRSYEFVLFLGPQKLRILESYDYDFERVMAFSNWFLIDGVAKLLYRFMHLIHQYVPNWGFSILILAILVNGLLYPLNSRGMRALKAQQVKMQALQPKLNDLREKYKDNPQKLNKEMAQLYKEHHIHPMGCAGGCLPMLIQFPVFIGLYQVLWRSVSLKGADFLWIKDLSEPDRLFLLPFSIPFLGNEFNILPLVMLVLVFIQQKVSTRNMQTTDPNMMAQQKMMAWMFPLMMLFIFYKVASGLTLYFVVLYCFTLFTQLRMSKLNG